MFIYIYKYIHICADVFFVDVNIHMYACVFVCVYIYIYISAYVFICFSPTATSVAQGSLAQITFDAIRCSFNAKFRGRFRYRGWVRFCTGQVPEGSGARLGEVPEGSGADPR